MFNSIGAPIILSSDKSAIWTKLIYFRRWTNIPLSDWWTSKPKSMWQDQHLHSECLAEKFLKMYTFSIIVSNNYIIKSYLWEMLKKKKWTNILLWENPASIIAWQAYQAKPKGVASSHTKGLLQAIQRSFKMTGEELAYILEAEPYTLLETTWRKIFLTST